MFRAKNNKSIAKKNPFTKGISVMALSLALMPLADKVMLPQAQASVLPILVLGPGGRRNDDNDDKKKDALTNDDLRADLTKLQQQITQKESQVQRQQNLIQQLRAAAKSAAENTNNNNDENLNALRQAVKDAQAELDLRIKDLADTRRQAQDAINVLAARGGIETNPDASPNNRPGPNNQQDTSPTTNTDNNTLISDRELFDDVQAQVDDFLLNKVTELSRLQQQGVAQSASDQTNIQNDINEIAAYQSELTQFRNNPPPGQGPETAFDVTQVDIDDDTNQIMSITGYGAVAPDAGSANTDTTLGDEALMYIYPGQPGNLAGDTLITDDNGNTILEVTFLPDGPAEQTDPATVTGQVTISSQNGADTRNAAIRVSDLDREVQKNEALEYGVLLELIEADKEAEEKIGPLDDRISEVEEDINLLLRGAEGNDGILAARAIIKKGPGSNPFTRAKGKKKIQEAQEFLDQNEGDLKLLEGLRDDLQEQKNRLQSKISTLQGKYNNLQRETAELKESRKLAVKASPDPSAASNDNSSTTARGALRRTARSKNLLPSTSNNNNTPDSDDDVEDKNQN